MVEEQTELFSKNEGTGLKPRDKKAPAINKNTEASASVFGWRFQIFSAIILSIIHIADLQTVEVEGLTEDIELYFKSSDPEYIQVKALQNNIDATDTQKATLAMNTLINTSNITKGKYSKLVYVSNLLNPMSLTDVLQKAIWSPSAEQVLSKNYTSLPKAAKKFIDARIASAQKQLQHHYMSSTDFLDKNRLYITTILFSSNEDTTQKGVLGGTLSRFLYDANIKPKEWLIPKLSNSLVNYYLASAGSSATIKHHLKITKERLFWRIVFEIIGTNSDEDVIPYDVQDKVEEYVENVIESQSENILIVNKIYSEFDKAYSIPNATLGSVKKFASQNWKLFKEDFPVDDSRVQQFGIETLILKIMSKRTIISKLRKQVNL